MSLQSKLNFQKSEVLPIPPPHLGRLACHYSIPDLQFILSRPLKSHEYWDIYALIWCEQRANTLKYDKANNPFRMPASVELSIDFIRIS